MLLQKIESIYQIGGLKLVVLKIKDELFKTDSGKWYEYHIFESADPKDYPHLLKSWFRMETGENLDLENPRTFNEKIQWLKLYDTTPLKTRLADKYLVQEWIKEKIGEKYLIPLLGVWDQFDDIDFDLLPDQFVLKCNHGCGCNMIVKDKSTFDRKEAKKNFDEWMKTNYAFVYGLELQYKDIPPKIICEKYIEQTNKDIYDYKISCFDGQPKFLWVDSDRYANHSRCLYDLNWNKLPFEINSYYPQKEFERPADLDEMIHLARVLSEGFAYVRVDLYYCEGKIYFGEMTFTSASGTEDIMPTEWRYKLGDLIQLPLN